MFVEINFKWKTFYVLIIIFAQFSSNTKKEAYELIAVNEDKKEGKKLMETNCYLCHSPNAPKSGITPRDGETHHQPVQDGS